MVWFSILNLDYQLSKIFKTPAIANIVENFRINLSQYQAKKLKLRINSY